ncbi:sugar-binding transcriptional regulator [Thermovenabulum gondwanense]|uniref:Central glycolytic genes regulator n=1 Tax=Thermovenabulum gondwanense TaxID=520767 RepID=A0A162N140_9FIRM|nr:sugar-binding domain-containing protein [Thermovenabulum gondwanense]KYO68656.1 Central glycolytic genes regulator [Thermovenabulum gondwanense]
MENIAELIKKISPESVEIIEKRYRILKNIQYYQPIGRRLLANYTHFTERTLRTEIKKLLEFGLLEIDDNGMKLTKEGESLIGDMEEFIFNLKGLNRYVTNIENMYNCHCLIVPGDADSDESVKREMGKKAATLLKSLIRGKEIIAVTGGSTMAEVPRGITKTMEYENVMVVPARGGLGERVEYQANTIAAEMAKKLGAKYKLLFVPENLRPETLKTIIEEPVLSEVISMIKRADILIHGIGIAEEMARRRGLSQREVEIIKEKGAVAEAFGYYFDIEGKVVHYTPSAGIGIDEIKNISTVISVAGGKKKALAIKAFIKFFSPKYLITDEGAVTNLMNWEGTQGE